MDRESMEACLRAALEAAVLAGAILEERRQRLEVREKGRFDLVTDADLASQNLIQAFLHERFPSYAFLGEESREAMDLLPENQPAWIVDPLDGTTNYVHDCPVYAVSIGLVEAAECLLGVIHDPSRGETFHAARGRGAWLNGKPLRVSAADSLENALVSAGFPPDLRGQEHALEAWCALSLRTQSLRRTGSTALNLAYVAAGRHDGFWTHQAFPWDAAAGIILIREAGGLVTKVDGRPYDWHTLDLLASNGRLHPALLDVFAAIEADRR